MALEPLPSGAPHLAPPGPSLPTVPEGAPVGRPVALWSWPGEGGDGPRWGAARSGAPVGLRTCLAPRAAWCWGPARGSWLRPAGEQRHLLAARARIGAVGAALGWGCRAAGTRKPRGSAPTAGPAPVGLACPREGQAPGSRDSQGARRGGGQHTDGHTRSPARGPPFGTPEGPAVHLATGSRI